jgi:hypothetical protein
MIDIDAAKVLSSQLAKETIKSKEEMLLIDDMLNAIWYSNHAPETITQPEDIQYRYDVYDHPQYINNLDVCFKYYTRINLLTSLKFFRDLKIAPATILDLYGGDGRASALLATAFPNAMVYYHQTAKAQIELAHALFDKLQLKNVAHTDKALPVEAIFAFECFDAAFYRIEVP